MYPALHADWTHSSLLYIVDFNHFEESRDVRNTTSITAICLGI
ncbi:hypothetical protein CES86_0362 [Brucella lupini]|uniref:Uncharacterized protein n=1 Tax=Brucella lupini TaxID=255457 RepID=A0A256GYG8_9HYPH|nr:hypothetical protein CES86_0362 [Brucella lupini]